MLGRAPTLLLLVFASCGDPAPSGVRRAPLLGGVEAPEATEVFRLEIVADNGLRSSCSATLIAARTLLTAAHCVDPQVLSANSVSVVATNAPSLGEVTPANTFTVVEIRLHPEWRPAINLDSDLALLAIDPPPSVPPRALNFLPLDGLEGRTVTLFGYGTAQASPDAGMTTRRALSLPIRQLSPTLISLGDFTNKGLCHGDSGGPTTMLMNDGVERLIGVHSFTRSADCTDGADTRLDAFAPFFDAWLQEKEDVCGADGVCATGVCAMADLDCLGPAEPCRYALQCPRRRCERDPQHDAPYCTSACPCAGPLVCVSGGCQLPQLPEVALGGACVVGQTWCTGGTRCDGASPTRPVCSRPCAADAECQRDAVCRPGFSGQRVCVPREVKLPIARWEGPVFSGCSALGGGPLAVLGWLALLLCRGHAGKQRNC